MSKSKKSVFVWYSGFFQLLLWIAFIPEINAQQGSLETDSKEADGNGEEHLYYLVPEVIITANRYDPDHKKTHVEQKITEEELEESGLDQLADIIEKEPSVGAAGAGYHRSPIIRGLGGRRSLLLINGERTDTLLNTGPTVSYISPFAVEEIEVYRGPFSTIYGSDAIGGIINIITKNPDLSEDKFYDVQLNNNYMSNGDGVNSGLSAAVGTPDLYFSAGGTFRNRGDTEYDGGSVDDSGYTDYTLYNSFFWRFTSKQSVKVQYRYSEGIDIGKPTGDENRRGEHPTEVNQSTSVKYQNHFNGKVFKDLHAFVSAKTVNLEVEMDVENPDMNVSVDNQVETSIAGIYAYQLYQTLAFLSSGQLIIGSSGIWEKGVEISGQKKVYDLSTGYFKNDSGIVPFIENGESINSGIFAEVTYDFFRDLRLDAGVRYDIFLFGADWQSEEYGALGITSDSGTKEMKQLEALSYHGGASYRFAKYYSVFGNIGTAFRAPAIKELFYTGSTPLGYTISNPDLKPEKSLNTEGGIRWITKKVNSSLSVFRNDIRDYITVYWNEDHTIGQFENIGRAEITGVEGNLDLQLPYQFSWLTGATYMEGRDTVLDEPLEDVPPLEILTALSYRHNVFRKISFKHTAQYSYSHEEEEAITGDEPAAAFSLWDYLFAAQWGENYRLTLSVTNIADVKYRRYSQPVNVYSSGRSFNAGLHMKF